MSSEDILSKSLQFNSRYSNTPAFKTAFTIIRACGDTAFYLNIKDGLSGYLEGLKVVAADKICADLKVLEPKVTNVSPELLGLAQDNYNNLMQSVHQSAYEFESQTEYEDMSYEHQVFFCLVSAFSFLAEVQRVERMVLQVHEGMPEFLKELDRKKRMEEVYQQRAASRTRRGG